VGVGVAESVKEIGGTVLVNAMSLSVSWNLYVLDGFYKCFFWFSYYRIPFLYPP
jgi:hypothetical protein